MLGLNHRVLNTHGWCTTHVQKKTVEKRWVRVKVKKKRGKQHEEKKKERRRRKRVGKRNKGKGRQKGSINNKAKKEETMISVHITYYRCVYLFLLLFFIDLSSFDPLSPPALPLSFLSIPLVAFSISLFLPLYSHPFLSTVFFWISALKKKLLKGNKK
jgi:hypothetical protein